MGWFSSLRDYLQFGSGDKNDPLLPVSDTSTKTAKVNNKNNNSSSNKNNFDNSNKICVDCNREKAQKELPATDSISSSSHHGEEKRDAPCEIPYKNVNNCMTANKGQISSCVKEWQIFRECHDKHKIQRS